MAKFPEPPGIPALQSIPPQMIMLAPGFRLYRIFRSAGPHPVYWNTFRHFGPTSARFDHHLPDEFGNPQVADRGILYAAMGRQAIPTCLAEAFQTSRSINRRDGRPVLAAFTLVRPLTLLDLTGAFATRIGASMAINSGPRPRARRWAQQLYDAFPAAHGIHYSSSMHANLPSIALFERSHFALPAAPDFHRHLDDPALADIILKTGRSIGYTVVDP